jgi:hypothetical protein
MARSSVGVSDGGVGAFESSSVDEIGAWHPAKKAKVINSGVHFIGILF